ARPQLGRPPPGRTGRRVADPDPRKPLRPAGVAAAQAGARLGLLLGHVSGRQGHDQRVSLLESHLRRPPCPVLAIPIFLAFAAAALPLVRLHGAPDASGRARLGAAALLGFFGAAQALTNAWDVPLLSGLLVVTALAAALAGERLTLAGLGRGIGALGVAAASAYLLARPLWVRAGGAPGIGRNGDPPASRAGLLLEVGGCFLPARVG